MELIAKKDTFIKVRAEDPDQLDKVEIIKVKKGTTINIEDVIENGDHLYFSGYLQEDHLHFGVGLYYFYEDINVMARTIYGEARDENTRLAVAWVVRNRATKSPAYNWPNTPRAVCEQPGQFRCWDNDHPDLPKLLALTEMDEEFRQCLGTARGVLAKFGKDPTDGCDHYHANRDNPDWAKGLDPVRVIGNLKFFRLVEIP